MWPTQTDVSEVRCACLIVTRYPRFAMQKLAIAGIVQTVRQYQYDSVAL